ncbi:hypothetical protein TL16_g10227 [Triparma laevis f. inornata]|uniref:Uncharacterized protein n=1 Tax=Triparma laevis f. inornata TaxID=1714386 RepID=A0A9W7B758_9STRA|nr:hypothetical protein TL16_g10227 [Triparma laevis f. inornata]
MILIPMTTVKREKMFDEDDVVYVDEIEIKIEIKREEGERIEKEEEDRREKMCSRLHLEGWQGSDAC